MAATAAAKPAKSAAPKSSAAKPAASKSGAPKSGAAKAPDAIAVLKADHREAEELFEKFENAKDDSRKKAIADQVCTALTVHTQIEEEIFYPACKGVVEDDLIDEADVEHQGAKRLIGEILAGQPSEPLWEAKVTVLSEYIKHHVKEEEAPGGMFAQARKGKLDLKTLGAQLAQRKTELMAENKAAPLQ